MANIKELWKELITFFVFAQSDFRCALCDRSILPKKLYITELVISTTNGVSYLKKFDVLQIRFLPTITWFPWDASFFPFGDHFPWWSSKKMSGNVNWCHGPWRGWGSRMRTEEVQTRGHAPEPSFIRVCAHVSSHEFGGESKLYALPTNPAKFPCTHPRPDDNENEMTCE